MSERLVMEMHLADIFNWTLLQSKKKGRAGGKGT